MFIDRIRGAEEKVEINAGLGVLEETAPLKKVLMWGEPGAEAVLGILLPTDISHFQVPLDVHVAREEFQRSKKLIEANGVEVVQVKDLFAKMLLDQGCEAEEGIEDIRKRLIAKGLEYRERYPEVVSRDRDVNISGWPDWLNEALDEDVAKYGEKVAVRLNQQCSDRDGSWPLANLMYARDQSNLVRHTFIFSSMKHEIRRDEVDIYRSALNYAGIINDPNIDIVSIKGEGRFEGGDGIVHDGIVYIGAGGRTNKEGILQLAPSILKSGKRLLVPFDSERATGKMDEMDAMHLDTFWMPIGPNEVVSCQTESGRRELLEVVNSNGTLKFENRGWFTNYMAKKNMDIVPLTKDEQEHYAPNFLNLGNGKIILSLSEGNNLVNELTKRGKTVMNADLKNITKGFGGLHCMTAAIKRG